MTTHTILNQNQKTIASLQAKDFYGAVQSALSALRDLKRNSFGYFNETTAALEIPDDALDQCMRSDKGSFGIGDATTIGPFTYDRAIPIPTTVMDDAQVTTILIFNAALANHLLAAHKNDDQSIELLHKARQLYQLAHDSQGGGKNIFFHSAVINKVATIDHLLGNSDSAHSSFEYLVSTVMMLRTQEQSDLFSDLSVFLLNMPVSIKTAAAA